jgi:hypothetical protein
VAHPSSRFSRHGITVDSSGIFEYDERQSTWRGLKMMVINAGLGIAFNAQGVLKRAADGSFT